MILAFITSRVGSKPLLSEVLISETDEGFSATGLRVSSTVQLHRLMTVRVGMIRRDLGTLSPRLQAEVASRLRLLFGLG